MATAAVSRSSLAKDPVWRQLCGQRGPRGTPVRVCGGSQVFPGAQSTLWILQWTWARQSAGPSGLGLEGRGTLGAASCLLLGCVYLDSPPLPGPPQRVCD